MSDNISDLTGVRDIPHATPGAGMRPGEGVVNEICNLNWRGLSGDETVDIAWVYYYFSVQFRENLEIARKMFPLDEQLIELDRGERDTDNLSPFPNVVAAGERVNHDEFMRRALALTRIRGERREKLERIGAAYLCNVRATDDLTRALSMSSYEDGGLERVFSSMLDAPVWDGPVLQAFKHFLVKHIEFDSDVENGHGGLCRHLPPNDGVAKLWEAFRDSLIEAVPTLSRR